MVDLDLTREFHKQNSERLGKLEDKTDRQSEILTRIDSNTTCIPDLVKRVEALEKDKSKVTGALWVLGVLWGGIEALFHFVFHKN